MEFAMNESYFQKEMNDNILEEILVRLPLKSLCRFKCVSKPWCRLISDKHFQKRLPFISTGVLFQSESNQFKTPKYAYTSQNGIIENCNLDFFPFNEKSTIVDGCNGLLLSYVSESRTFYVINTVTKRWIELPRSNKRSQLSVLAFDPYSSSHYKVVCFTEWRARGAELEIYSSETSEWGLCKINFGVEKDAISATKHYFNGVLYILAYPNMIVAINLTKSLCDLIRLPEPTNREGRVGHNQGHLHYAHIDGNKMKIWMLKDLKDPSGWNLKHEIYLMELIESQEIHLNQVNLVAFHPEKDLVYLWVPWKIVNCRPRERKLEGIWEFEKEGEKTYLIQIWLFPCTSYLTKCLA